MNPLFSRMHQMASDAASAVSRKMAKIPSPSFTHAKKALEVLKNDLNVSWKLAVCPVADGALSIKQIIRLKINRSACQSNFSACHKMLLELHPGSGRKQEHIQKLFSQTLAKIKAGGSTDSLQGLQDFYSANCADLQKVKKFNMHISAIKKNVVAIDKDIEKTKDKFEIIRAVTLGVLLLPALPLTIGLGGVYSLFSAVDALYTLSTGKKFQLHPVRKPRTRMDLL